MRARSAGAHLSMRTSLSRARAPPTYSAPHRYEKKITDYNFGSLIRTDATGAYNESNTIFGAFVFMIASPSLLLMGNPYARLDSNANTGEVSFALPSCHVLTLLARTQFYAIEVRPTASDRFQYSHQARMQISRNRLGLNDKAHEVAKEEACKEREKAEKIKAGKKKSGAP